MATDSPSSRSEILKLASEYLENENPGKAIKLLEGAGISEGDTELQHRLASAYADRKWGKKAIAQYLKCLSNDNIYPSLVQEFSEFMLDSGEHKALTAALCDLLKKPSVRKDTDLSAVCMAMIYSALGDCTANNIETDLNTDFLADYLKENPDAAGERFFVSVLKYLSETPNDTSIVPLTNTLQKTMVSYIPGIINSRDFQSAAADFEISLILFSNSVNPLTVLALRTAKLKFASASDDTDQLRYLVFEAKMSLVDSVRTVAPDTEKFMSVYPFLWSLISGFVNGAIRTPDLKKFTRDEIYSELRNASPRLMSIIESSLSADGFASLKKFISSPESAPKPVLYSGSSKPGRPVSVKKTSPNEPCPCGSGKKYKKCCGLK